MARLTILLSVVLIIFGACRKDSFISSPDAAISFSSDTLYYDTVFTATGSVTKFVRIYNNNNQKLKLSGVELGGGSSSPFRINVDGLPGPATEVEIEANDSLYIFVSVIVDPTAENQPFILSDSLRINFNGNSRFVQLRAWGQNANFLRNHTVTGNESWSAEKPWVILDRLTVSENATLTIGKGSKLYFHADAPLLVQGSLIVKGEQWDSTRVRMQGDRLDPPYNEYPGSWPGIYFGPESHDNLLEYTVISHAYQGIVTEEPSINNSPKITLRQTAINNCFDAGIIAVRSDISAENLLISNCGKNLVLAFGGRYDFTHLTNVGYSNSYVAHSEPVLAISNSAEDASGIYTADLDATFINCIFWGEEGIVKDEVAIDRQGNSPFNVKLSHSLWKISSVPANVTADNMMQNQDPQFRVIDNNRRGYDFRLREGSPAIRSGFPTNVLTDLNGNIRSLVNPDMGAFEQP